MHIWKGRIGVLANRGTSQRAIGGTGNKQKSVEGTREQLVCFQGTGKSKNRERLSFYTEKPDQISMFAKFVNWYNKIFMRFVYMTSALCCRRLPAFFWK